MLVSYHEDMAGTDQDVFLSSFYINPAYPYPLIVEDHVQVAPTGRAESRAAICSRHTSGSTSNYCMTVWDRAADPSYPSIIGAWVHYSY